MASTVWKVDGARRAVCAGNPVFSKLSDAYVGRDSGLHKAASKGECLTVTEKQGRPQAQAEVVVEEEGHTNTNTENGIDTDSNGGNKVLSYASLLRCCEGAASLLRGRRIHALIARDGLHRGTFLGNTLVEMYGKCGSPDSARAAFDTIALPNAFSWSIMIGAYRRTGRSHDAFETFWRMQSAPGPGRTRPDSIVFVSILGECAVQTALPQGKSVHALLHAHALVEGFRLDVVARNALIHMYGKCGRPSDARRLFDGTRLPNVVSWTAMIAAYAQNGRAEDALELFDRMWRDEHINPNTVTFVSVLSACTSLATLVEGKAVHARMIADAVAVASNPILAIALVKMYGKCGGCVDDALRLFRRAGDRGRASSWNAAMDACTQNGRESDCLELFGEMKRANIKPDAITFVNVLTACAYRGLIDEGLRLFASMGASEPHRVIPREEHYGRMVELFGRAGWLDEAERAMERMPTPLGVAHWRSLLNACKAHGDVERGVRAAEHILELSPGDTGTMVTLSHIYAAASMWDEAAKVRENIGG